MCRKEGVCVCYSLRPALSSGHSEEGEQGPRHVVVVEIVLLPLPLLSFYFIPFVHQKLSPEIHTETKGVSRQHVCVCVRERERQRQRQRGRK